MSQRVRGVQKERIHIYLGLEILTRKEFVEWALNDPKFFELFDRWTKSRFDQRWTPSIDRIDRKYGYVLGNIQWLTNSENSGKDKIKPKLIVEQDSDNV